MMVGKSNKKDDVERMNEIAKCPDYIFKIIVVGDRGTGKTSLIKRISTDEFNSVYAVTLAGDFASLFYTKDEDTIKITLWDTCGLEQYRSLTKHYYSGAECVLLMYDLTSTASFKKLSEWLSNVRTGTPANTLIFLVASKADLVDAGLKQALIEEYVNKEQLTGKAIVSAKTGEGVQELVAAMIQKLIEKRAVHKHRGPLFQNRTSSLVHAAQTVHKKPRCAC